MNARDTDWDGVRLHVVTGKGGTGKTTVAAALALALASGGRKTLLVEVEGRQGIAQLFDQPPLGYEERRIAVARDGGDVYGLAIDAEQALYEYLSMFYKLGQAARGLKRIGAIEFATTIAPGLRDVLLTGKTCEAVRRKQGGRFVYDAVVMDAPPTGRITRFLNVNQAVAGLARFGPIHHQAEAVMSVIRSPATAVHCVTVLEEMPVQETVDAVAELRAADLPVGGVIVNMVRPDPLGDQLTRAAAGQIAREEVSEALHAVGLKVDETVVTALLDEAQEHAQRIQMEREERAIIAELGLPTYELPLLTDGVDLGGLYQLAEALRDQGAA